MNTISLIFSIELVVVAALLIAIETVHLVRTWKNK